jgi:hypothetical protein
LWVGKLATDRDPDVSGGSEDQIRQTIQLIDDEIEAVQHLLADCDNPVLPPPRFTLEPWQLVTPLGIDVYGDGSYWETGSVWCVRPIGNQRLLLGTENGGLWLSEPNDGGGYNSTCLSDAWPYWAVWCMAADPQDATSVYAGCNAGGLYHVDASSPQAAAQGGTQIPLPVGMATADIHAIFIDPASRHLFVATNAGLAWFGIGQSPIVWSTGVTSPVHDLALLADGDFAMIADLPGIDQKLHIANVGNGFSSTPVPDSAIKWTDTPYSYTPMRVGSCATRPANVYCLGTKVLKFEEDDGGRLFTSLSDPKLFVIRSRDNGQTWQECQYGGNLPAGNDLAIAIDFSDPGPKSNRGISVHPQRPEVVAIGYLSVAVSPNSGDSWDTETYRGHVNDIHEILFDADADVMHVPSDKGILTFDNWAPWVPGMPGSGAPAPIDSGRNERLPVAMLYAPSSWFGGYGNLAVSEDGSLIASGTQDQADLWCGPLEAWRRADSGDGCAVALSTGGERCIFVHSSQGDNSGPGPANWAVWDGNSWVEQGVINTRRSDLVLDSSGIAPLIRRVSDVNPVFISVAVTTGGNQVRSGPLPVFALAVRYPGDSVIFGAVDNPLTNEVEWIDLVHVSPLLGDVIKVEPYSPTQILAGTSDGHLIIATVGTSAISTGTSMFYPYEEIEFAQSDATGGVDGIAATGDVVLAVRGNALYVRNRAGGQLERLSAAAFPPNGRGDATFAGIAMNLNPAFQRLSCAVVVRDNDNHPGQPGEVWVSNSPIAAVWHKAAGGLPRGIRTADVAFSNNPRFGELFLSTYGRSVWRTTF